LKNHIDCGNYHPIDDMILTMEDYGGHTIVNVFILNRSSRFLENLRC